MCRPTGGGNCNDRRARLVTRRTRGIGGARHWRYRLRDWRSWLSAIGLLLLAYTASFAAIDWVLSLDPHFWSAVFPMIMGAHWFNTGLALVLIVVAMLPASALVRDHLGDLAAILFATIIFWAYVEFCQFLIVWEGNLSHEIPWYLRRIAGAWQSVTWGIAVGVFFVPFALLLWRKRSRLVVITAGVLLLASRR